MSGTDGEDGSRWIRLRQVMWSCWNGEGRCAQDLFGFCMQEKFLV